MQFADVIIDRSLQNLDRTFQYHIPEEMEKEVTVGALVEVPFGKGNRQITGYVIGISEKPKFAVEKTKDIIKVVKEGVVIESQLLALAYFIHENYGSTLNDALKTVLPVKKTVKQKEKRTILLAIDKEQATDVVSEYKRKHYTAKVRLLEALLEYEKLSYDNVVQRLHIPITTLRKMEQDSIITIDRENQYRNPIKNTNSRGKTVELNLNQTKIVSHFVSEYANGKRGCYLIHGVTGSGKTEVYMEIIDAVLKEGKQVIMLISEIALTFQTVNRFYTRFGDRISILHSRLSMGERYDQYLRAKNGEIDIMIGPRSAVFTPFSNLGLIIIDEEHESSYKSEMPPKYHAREVAVKRASLAGASVVLGSATPSLEAYTRALNGRYTLYQLQERAGKGTLPNVHITDLREEFAKKNRSIFGELLQNMISDRLQKKQQIILFLNRRGYAGFVSCRKCGYVMKCPHCDISLTSHHYGKQVSKLVCHYCGYEREMPQTCPECASKYIAAFGTGTQKVEEMVKEKFPTARVLRMDADTTSQKGGHEGILAAFANQQADILIGTQMIVKGHDFPNVTLVGILAADMSLNVGSFQASERTFQLLSQAAGRAGRGEIPGDVVIQTYQPDHFCIQTAATHDYQQFYETEMKYRKMLQYPPVSNILAILVLSENEEAAVEAGKDIAKMIQATQGVRVIGPAAASLAKAKDVYRQVIYVKSKDYIALRTEKNKVLSWLNMQEKWKDIRVQFDFNPMGNI